MYIDNELLFSGAGGWSPTATGDNISPVVWDSSPLGNLINTNTGRDLGAGEELVMDFLVTATVTSAGAATCTFELVTDSTNNIATPNVLVQSPAIPKASLVAGTVWQLKLPRGSALTSLWKRYVGADINIGTAVLTAGTFHVSIKKATQDKTLYQAGYTVK